MSAAATAVAGAPATLTDADGSVVRFTLTGPGTVAVDVDGGAFDLAVTGATARTSLAVSVLRGGDRAVLIDDLSVDGTLNKLTAPAAVATGLWDVPAIGTLTIKAVAGATIESYSLGSVSVGGSVVNGKIYSPHISALKVGTDLVESWVGLYPHRDDQVQGFGRMTVRGAMRNSSVDALADVGAITVGAMSYSNVVAGVRWDVGSFDNLVSVLPTDRGAVEGKDFDFTGTYAIASVTITGLKGSGARVGWFQTSNIAAYALGKVSLARVSSTGADRAFGVSAYAVGVIRNRVPRPSNGVSFVKLSDTSSKFTVRQISEPIDRRNLRDAFSGNGSSNPRLWNGSGYSTASASFSMGLSAWDYSFSGFSGAVVSSGGLTLENPNPPTTYTLPVLPVTGTKVATVVNSAATDIFLTRARTYEARSADGSVIEVTNDLSSMIMRLVGVAGKAIKEWPTNTFLSTSVGPQVRFFNTSRTYALDEAFAVQLINGTIASQAISLPQRADVVPGLTVGSLPLVTITGTLLMLDDVDPLAVGRRVDTIGPAHDISLTPSHAFALEGAGEMPLVDALMGDPPLAGGSRRLPVRLKLADDGKLYLYGLVFGGTAVIDHVGTQVLDAAGDLSALPTAAEVKQQLLDAGVPLVAYGV